MPQKAHSICKRLAWLMLGLALLTGPSAAVDGDEMFADPAREARAREVGRQLRCLVCQNQSIFDSNSGLAKDLRVLVRTRMDEGDTDSEILAFIADRYGDYVLLNPRVSVQTAVLWGAPIGALVLGFGIAFGYLRARQTPVRSAELSDADRAAARELLKEGRS